MTERSGSLLVIGTSEVVTCDAHRGVGRVGRIEKGAVAIEDGRIAWVGSEADLPNRFRQDGVLEIDAQGRSIVPGFVDAHTHLIFAGNRREEFAARAQGKEYEAGGILTTVDATRRASDDELVRLVTERCDAMLHHGTTTAEAKSGYSLDLEGEIRLLRLLSEVHRTNAIDLEITFLGAHVVPPEFQGRDDDYVTLVCEEMMPAASGLAGWCDVFCDRGAFTPVQARRVLEAGKANGLAPRIHANELDHSGGASVAANVGAASADHLLFLRPTEAKALAVAGCAGVICPTTAMSLGRFPNVDLMREVGMKIVIASDLNPGMDPSGNLQFSAAVAIRMMGFGPEEALLAMTAGGASSVRRDDIGRLAPGCLGDLVVLASDSVLDLGYQAGMNLASMVIKDGVVVPN